MFWVCESLSEDTLTEVEVFSIAPVQDTRARMRSHWDVPGQFLLKKLHRETSLSLKKFRRYNHIKIEELNARPRADASRPKFLCAPS